MPSILGNPEGFTCVPGAVDVSLPVPAPGGFISSLRVDIVYTLAYLPGFDLTN